MNNWKVIFATAIIFGAGVITGGLLVNYVQHSQFKPVHPPTAKAHSATTATNPLPRLAEVVKPRLPEILSKQFLQRLDDDLRLSPDQHEAVQKIILESQNAMRKIVQDARLEIRDAVTAEQRKQFDELMKHAFHKPLFGTNAAANLTNAPVTVTNPPAI